MKYLYLYLYLLNIWIICICIRTRTGRGLTRKWAGFNRKWVGLSWNGWVFHRYVILSMQLIWVDQKLLYLLLIRKLFTWQHQHWASDQWFWSRKQTNYIQNKFCNNEYNTCGCNYEVKCNEQEFSSQHNFLFFNLIFFMISVICYFWFCFIFFISTPGMC